MSKKSNKKKEVPTMDSVLALLSKQSHKGLSAGNKIVRKDKISTGSIKLDRELEGGYVHGKIIECFGPESTGKSALGYSMLAGISGIKGFIDAESAYEKETAEMYGVDTSSIIVQEPEYIEQAMQVTLSMVEAGITAVMFDSVAGIAPKVEAEGSMEDHNVGKKASRMGQMMRKLHIIAARTPTTCFFVNQIRERPGVMFGSPFTTPGGHALRFHASYRLQIISTPAIKAGDRIVGHHLNMKIVKNKFGPPGGRVMIPLIYGQGISKEWEVLELALEAGIFKQSGSWISCEGSNIAQGKYNAYTFLLDNPEFFEDIKTKV